MTILLCTAEKILLTSLEYRFRKNGWNLQVAHNYDDVVEAVRKMPPEMMAVDLRMPELKGLEIIQHVHNNVDSDIAILAYGELKEEQLLMEALRLGASDFIVTPLKPSELVLRIRHILLKQKVAG